MLPVVSVVDDDESCRNAISSLVRSLGMVARTYSSAEEFLQSDHVSDTSCLITDVQMPGMTGMDLQNYLSARKHRIPIIFITAFPAERIRKTVLAAGAIGFLSKPFDADAMVKFLHLALNQGR